jgi:hypothetical protein
MTQGGIRPREELQAGLLRLRQDHLEWLSWSPRPNHDPEDTYTEGQMLALEWLLGAVESTPLTLRAGIDPEDVREIDREADHATDMLQGRTAMDLRGKSFVAGVEFALMWVRYQTVDPEL